MIPAMPAFSSIYNYGDLWTVKKIIRLHGGKIIGYGYGKVVTYQVIMPKYFQSQSEADTGMALSVKKQKVYLEETVSTAEGKSRTDKKESKSCILLVMARQKV